MRGIPLPACFMLFCQLITELTRVFITWRMWYPLCAQIYSLISSRETRRPAKGTLFTEAISAGQGKQAGRARISDSPAPPILCIYDHVPAERWSRQAESRCLLSLPPLSVTIFPSTMSWSQLQMGEEGEALWVRRPPMPHLLELRVSSAQFATAARNAAWYLLPTLPHFATHVICGRYTNY